MLGKILNTKGTLISLATPLVMGILNVTPDSSCAGNRKQTEITIEDRIREALSEGGDWIDIGGYSSHPDAAETMPEEEVCRLELALHVLNRHYSDIPMSVDTFRAEITRRYVEEYGMAVTNDISGDELNAGTFQTVTDLKIPYTMMYMRGTLRIIQRHTGYLDMMKEVMLYFSWGVHQLRLLGVDGIIPNLGFGSSKMLKQNYQLMSHLEEFSIFELPLLAEVSYKSMIYRLLGRTPASSLNGATVLNTYALLNGTNVLRVHDAWGAVEAVCVIDQMTNK